jgi:hypothetical protein
MKMIFTSLWEKGMDFSVGFNVSEAYLEVSET